jgi:hypothetical protein
MGGIFCSARTESYNLMKQKKIRVAILGGGEADLYVMGELHKQRDVEIAFVYDRYPAAVAVEIAEILGIPRVTSPEGLAEHLPVDIAIAGAPRDRYAPELEKLGKTEILDHSAALARLCRKEPPAAPAPPTTTSGLFRNRGRAPSQVAQ